MISSTAVVCCTGKSAGDDAGFAQALEEGSRVLSKQEWIERYGEQPAGADSGVKTIQEPAATALKPNCP
jgi:hypothetical protein